MNTCNGFVPRVHTVPAQIDQRNSHCTTIPTAVHPVYADLGAVGGLRDSGTV